jgi:hypothetical protein
MAGISRQVSPDEVMPFLARNIFLNGYRGYGSKGRPTEFLILLRRYVQQARELAILAGPGGEIRVADCGDATLLLRILGYRTRAGCGHADTFVEVENPDRAFLTTDSGFPLPELERTLQGRGPFRYTFKSTQVPIFLSERDWAAASKEGGRDKGDQNLLDTLLHDPGLARLYHAWAGMDPETQASLERSPGLAKLVPVAASLDFYGSYIRIQSGHVIVPGGRGAETDWRDLVGASPQRPGEFVLRLAAKDGGWLAVYFDFLSRLPADQQAHFVEPPRLRRCYEALRANGSSRSAVGSIFRPDATLLLLMTRLQWESNGDPRVPGNLQAWHTILNSKANSALARTAGVRIKGWDDAEGLLEALFAFSRVGVGGGPTENFLALSEIDRNRPAGHRLSPQTVELMASKFPEFSDQYLIFSEFPELSDASIARFLRIADVLQRIPNHALRGNAMGIFEANVGLWEIFARQGEIAGSKQDGSWQETINPFAHIASSAQLFDSGRNSLAEVLGAAGELTNSQDQIIELMAGPRQISLEGQRIHRELADRFRAVMDDQRLVSLDTLWALDDGLTVMAQGNPAGDRLTSLAEQLTEFQMPRPIFSRGERTEFTAGAYNNQHTESEMRTDLTKVLRAPASNAELEEARGELVPFLRDTLVGLNYAYYEPPGAQALHNNPLLVRSHDFSGETVMGMESSLWQTPREFGAGSPAGNGAHLVGSLANLPYVLAEIEEDFISPHNVQSLIWADLVPSVLTDAVVPRWWGVSRNELHAVALYQRAGEELLAAAAKNEDLRVKVLSTLSERMTPERLALLNDALQAGRVAEASPQITPADKFYLTSDFRKEFPGDATIWGPAGRELENLTRQDPAELSWERLSRDFGIPHPVLARTYARALVDIGPFPLFEGYSSQLLAETWDSTNLYWARLADEMGYPPEALNRLIPELTGRMIANIAASTPNDWQAILRAMQETGEEFRKGKAASLAVNGSNLQP